MKSPYVAPLFIPLKRDHFFAFFSGQKHEEYRMLGPRWNERTCAIGRPVVISMGYGRKMRLTGRVVGFHVVADPIELPGWRDCYGDTRGIQAAAIKIQLDTQ